MNELEFYRAVFSLLDDWSKCIDPEDIYVIGPKADTYKRARIFVTCNDVFDWGTADSDELTPDEIEPLKKACSDCEAAHPIFGHIWGAMLWASRKRGARPQGAMWSSIPTQLWPLFEAAAPERPVNLLNPLTPQQAVERKESKMKENQR